MSKLKAKPEPMMIAPRSLVPSVAEAASLPADAGSVGHGEPRGRQTASPPECPYCSKPATPKTADGPAMPAVVVVCVANKSEPFFTRYYCPNRTVKDIACPYSEKVPRPEMQRRMDQAAGREENFSAR